VARPQLAVGRLACLQLAHPGPQLAQVRQPHTLQKNHILLPPGKLTLLLLKLRLQLTCLLLLLLLKLLLVLKLLGKLRLQLTCLLLLLLLLLLVQLTCCTLLLLQLLFHELPDASHESSLWLLLLGAS
jgi:hypothetical protein